MRAKKFPMQIWLMSNIKMVGLKVTSVQRLCYTFAL